ncbi:sensor histidine kinase [Microbacterium sp. cf332]|uniref:sensor histidine kinase n=1 Tax=Microbacterium sp. cf332 TaxID=1761804 RepID=UPI0015A12DDC|nr:histidine kinase [Microbacterium sp. cf332]
MNVYEKSKSAGPTLKRDPGERLLGSTRSGAVFVITVFLVTVVQTLMVPLVDLATAQLPWPLVVPAVVGIPLLLAGCAVQAMVFLLLDRRPEIPVVVTTAVYLALVVGLEVPSWLSGMKLVIALSLFFLATRRRAYVSLLWLVGVSLVTVATVTLWVLSVAEDVQFSIAFALGEAMTFIAPAAGAVALGIWWGAQKRRTEIARERAESAEREHEHRVEQARDRERTRIAQELHDVAGQHIAGLITLTDAALQLAASRPDDARELMADVRSEGRFAAASLAGALSDLRAVGAELPEVTADLRRLDELISYWRKRGVEIDLVTAGDFADLPAVVSTSVYRCVQEALTNAAKHAPGAPVTVTVRHSFDRLSLVVENGRADDGRVPVAGLGLGWGLAGVTERIELLRGSLRTGPTPEGGWRLDLNVPVPPITD